jgi:hypothetical protein
MKLSKIALALAVATIVPVTPVLAGNGPTDVSSADESPAARQAPTTTDIVGGPTTGVNEASEGPSIEGTVAAIDHDSGRFVLDTDEGAIDLTTTPDELAGIGVGDFVRVSLVTIERNN